MHLFLFRGVRRPVPSNVLLVLPAALIIGVLSACGAAPEEWTEPQIAGGTDVERGRYLAVVGGCNDCHTDGYLQTEGKVPEEQWFTGSPLGWQGPWGTTYAANLRLTVQNLEEDAWVSLLQTRTARPPMPWMNVNKMSEPDMRALYRYLRSLGPSGVTMPPALPPEAVPTTPYLSLMPILPGT